MNQTARLASRILLAALMAAVAPWPQQAAKAATAGAPVRLLVLGDSLTAGYGLPVEDGFQARLAAALKAQGALVTLVDAAVSGDTTSDGAARLGWVLGGGPVDAALIELGGNDGLRGLDPALMQHAMTQILDALAAKHIPVLLSGMLAPPNLGADYDNRFRAVFTELGKRPDVIFDPFFLQGLIGHPELTQADGIHPNAAGVKIEVARLLPLVLQLVARAKAQETAKAPAG
ncbi:MULTISPECIES: arylesterase [unclassified Acidisoma]|uniref:arylesterase n=1 Tax=unclassified Acidisoma TaxID=2634065 RepID=UPI0020B167D7|nr:MULTISPECIES: arylesterase [unclassified Acidisoma]